MALKAPRSRTGGAAKATGGGDGVPRARLATGGLVLVPRGCWFLAAVGAIAHEFLPADGGVITRVSVQAAGGSSRKAPTRPPRQQAASCVPVDHRRRAWARVGNRGLRPTNAPPWRGIPLPFLGAKPDLCHTAGNGHGVALAHGGGRSGKRIGGGCGGCGVCRAPQDGPGHTGGPRLQNLSQTA